MSLPELMGRKNVEINVGELEGSSTLVSDRKVKIVEEGSIDLETSQLLESIRFIQ